MALRKTLMALLFSTTLTCGLTGCGGDDSEDIPSSSTPCSGNECETKSQDAKTKMASCDFVAAYDAIDSVYAAQLKNGNVDAQTALDRSILGIIHLLYRPEVQAILPKLGFIAKSDIVDFKPLWDGTHGFFKETFTANHDYDDLADLIPMSYFVNCKDDDDDDDDNCVDWAKTIDKTLTIDAILDALVSLKPELESIAISLENAANLTGSTALTPSAKCGFENIKLDAADLNAIAAMIMATDAAIDLISHYDFNFSLYDIVTANDDSVYENEPDYSYDYDAATAACEVDFTEDPVSDTCKERYDLDYKTLTCYDHRSNDGSRLRCAVPSNNKKYKDRVALADKLLQHVFRASTSKRKNTGIDGEAAFKKAATLFLNALNSSAKGSFFDFSKISKGALSDMKTLANEAAKGTLDLSKFIKPGLTVDLNKVFKDMLFAKDSDFQIDLSIYGIDTYGSSWIGDLIPAIFGEEIFLNESLPNYIFNTNLISHENYVDSDLDWIDVEFYVDDKYDATFSSDWEDMNLTEWLNPHEYFGLICEDGEYCEEKCPNSDTPYYIKDSSKTEGFFCSACSEKCEGETPYCYIEDKEYAWNNRCSAIDKCPSGYTISLDGMQCVPIEYSPCPEGLLENELCVSLYDGNEFIRYYCDNEGKVNSEYGSYYGKCKLIDISKYGSERKTIYVFDNAYESCSEESIETKCTHTEDSREAVAISSGCLQATDGSWVKVDFYEYNNIYLDVCDENHQCQYGQQSQQCLPRIGTPCPDELLRKDMCFDLSYGEKVHYFCNHDTGTITAEYDSSECKLIDVSEYTSQRDSIYAFNNSCSEEQLYKSCAIANDGHDAVQLISGCLRADDGSLINVELYNYYLYSEVCANNQYCDSDGDSPELSCIDVKN